MIENRDWTVQWIDESYWHSSNENIYFERLSLNGSFAVSSVPWLRSVPLPAIGRLTAHICQESLKLNQAYLSLIRLDNKFNFIAIFSLTVKIQYSSVLTAWPSLTQSTMVQWVGQFHSPLSIATCSCCSGVPSLAKLITWNFEIIIKTSNSAK